MTKTELSRLIEAAVRAVLQAPVAASLIAVSCAPSPADLEDASKKVFNRPGCIVAVSPPTKCLPAYAPLPCGPPPQLPVIDGGTVYGPGDPLQVVASVNTDPSADLCLSLCQGWPTRQCHVEGHRFPLADGGISDWSATVQCSPTPEYQSGCPIAGRQPPCERVTPRILEANEAAVLADMAFHEWRSADAFEQLAQALEQAGAPASLITRARRASKDERRHGTAVTELARRYGANSVDRPRQAASAQLTLEQWAFDNAVEGCVNETFSAAMMALQAQTATDPVVRSTFQRIAVDELSHAEFSRRFHAWALKTFGARLERARIEAWGTLTSRLAEVPSPDLATLGIEHQRRLALGTKLAALATA